MIKNPSLFLTITFLFVITGLAVIAYFMWPVLIGAVLLGIGAKRWNNYQTWKRNGLQEEYHKNPQ